MEALLLMGISGGEWLPLLAIMVAPMALLLTPEWIVDREEQIIQRRQDIHLQR